VKKRLASTAIAIVSIAFAHCGGGDAPQWRVGADCASGACDASGRCVPITNPSDTKTDTALDSILDDTADVAPIDDTKPVGCTPNADGIVTAAEIPLKAGLSAKYRSTTNVTVSTAGTTGTDGKRTWDFGKALSGDHDVLIQTQALAGKWFASKFATATYAATLSSTTDLLGVLQVNASALDLQGVVSPSDGVTRTELTYAKPISTLRFPLEVGTAWTASSTVNGVASGVASFYTEDYDTKVDARGEVITPFGTFPVLRVRTILKRTVGVIPTTTRTIAFIAECFGPVATVVSQPNETQDEFTNAAEIRRLTP